MSYLGSLGSGRWSHSFFGSSEIWLIGALTCLYGRSDAVFFSMLTRRIMNAC